MPLRLVYHHNGAVFYFTNNLYGNLLIQCLNIVYLTPAIATRPFKLPILK